MVRSSSPGRWRTGRRAPFAAMKLTRRKNSVYRVAVYSSQQYAGAVIVSEALSVALGAPDISLCYGPDKIIDHEPVVAVGNGRNPSVLSHLGHFNGVERDGLAQL